MQKKIICMALATMGLSLFTACDEEITKTVTEKNSIGSIGKFKDLDKCEGDVVGQMVYAKDSTKIFACTSDGWISLNGADGAKGEEGTSCTAKMLADSTGIEVTCGEKVIGTIKNGVSKVGTSCTGKKVDNGIEVTCGDSIVGIIENDSKGKSAFEIAQETDESVKGMTKEQWIASLKGEKGEGCTAKENPNGVTITCGKDEVTLKNGESCTVADNENNSAYITITCGDTSKDIAKALCNGIAYNPAIDYCNEYGIIEECAETDLWCKNKFYQVQTDLGNETKTAGFWFAFDDHAEQGNSSITWPVEIGNEYATNALDPVIEHCMGLCGTINIGTKITSYGGVQFAGVGFNIVGQTSNQIETPAAADVSGWGGICLYYTSDLKFHLDMSVGAENDANYYAYDTPMVVFPQSKNVTRQCFGWGEFKREGWADEYNPPEGYSPEKELVSLKFRFATTKTNISSNFNIIRMTKYNNNDR